MRIPNLEDELNQTRLSLENEKMYSAVLRSEIRKLEIPPPPDPGPSRADRIALASSIIFLASACLFFAGSILSFIREVLR